MQTTNFLLFAGGLRIIYLVHIPNKKWTKVIEHWYLKKKTWLDFHISPVTHKFSTLSNLLLNVSFYMSIFIHVSAVYICLQNLILTVAYGSPRNNCISCMWIRTGRESVCVYCELFWFRKKRDQVIAFRLLLDVCFTRLYRVVCMPYNACTLLVKGETTSASIYKFH